MACDELEDVPHAVGMDGRRNTCRRLPPWIYATTPMTYTFSAVTFVELPVFSSARETYLDDDEFSEIQRALINHPLAGDLIPASGGARKLRWMRSGMGKRGGLRVIYYHVDHRNQIWLLTLYSKNTRDNIQPQTLKKLTDAIHAETKRKSP